MQQILISQGETKHIVLFGSADTDLCITQQSGSSLRLHLLHLTDEDADMRITIEQTGEGCNTEIYGLFIARGQQHVDCLTRMRHLVGGGSSRQLLKYIVADRARCSFTGELYIAPDAQKTDAQQTNRNLLLSEKAMIQTKPQLEIYADDVKASHGASTGQMDESALFYMQQRCLSRTEARRLLMQAFAEEVVLTMPDSQQKDDILRDINTRLREIEI